MPEQDHGFRPKVDAFEHLGARIEVVDAGRVVRAAGTDPQPVLHDAHCPAPLRGLAVTLSTTTVDGTAMHRFRGELRFADPGPAHPRTSEDLLSALGTVAVPAAALVGAAVPLAAAAVQVMQRRWAQDRAAGELPRDPAAPNALGAAEAPEVPTGDVATVVSDPVTGLSGTVEIGSTRPDGRRTDVVAAFVPSEAVGPAHLSAFVRLVLDAARQRAGRPADPVFFRGRVYRLSALPDAQWVDVDEPGSVRLDQLGGLSDVVSQLREVAVSFNHPAAMARWGARRPQGILMYGPPGTGKTTLAKALATEIRGTLREIRTPEILDKWVGQSERNIKRIFAEARTYRRPTVLLFDEFDSIISYTGAPTDAASQMVNSVAGIFKQEMNTLVEENPNVIVVATTNFPHRVDESLIRSGRFDIKMSVPLPDTSARADILTTILRQLAGRYERGGFRMFADDIDVAELAELTPGMTGADFKEILRRAQLGKAMQEAHGAPAGPITQADLRRYVGQLRRLA